MKLLFLVPFAPDLRGTHGGARATAAMIDLLGQHHRVRVLYLVDPHAGPPVKLVSRCEKLTPVKLDLAKLKQLGRRNKVARTLAELGGMPVWAEACQLRAVTEQIAAVAREFQPDIVHHEFHVMAQYIPVVRKAAPHARCLVTEHEPGIIADREGGAFLSLRKRLRNFTRNHSWRRYEKRTLPEADGVVVFTQNDALALSQLLGPAAPPIAVIPLRLPEQPDDRSAAKTPVESDLLFVGNFRHPPNADAARRLVHDIFPLIARRLPDATLTIVGVDPPDDVSAAASDKITVTGWVDDPSVYLAGAKVVMVPLRQGGGLRVKMLEACAAGKAIIASPTAVEGLGLVQGAQVMLAESDEEFAQKATMLLGDPEARARLEAGSLAWSNIEQDAGQWAAQYADFYATLLAAPRAANGTPDSPSGADGPA